MKISAIMPCRNEEKYLAETLESLLKQTRLPDELIYASCSNDRSDEIMRSYIGRFYDHGCEVIMDLSEDALGLQRFNLSAKKATGEILFTCCANDLYNPEFVDHLAKCLEENPDIDIAYPYWTEFNDAGEQLYEFRAPADYMPYLKTLGNCIAGHSLFTKKMFEDVGGIINASVSGQPEDLNLWLRAIDKGYKAKLVPEVLLQWRRHVGQYSSTL